jgi:23S rRNA (pseudouridine1915-N3)-methyltransferase
MWRVVLDERGEQCTSRELAEHVGEWEQERVKAIAVLIGGADGHGVELRERADWVWSLGRLTIQHELALVLVMEQIYRAYAIKGGLPYHRD